MSLSLDEPGNKSLSDRWQLAMVEVLVAQPMNTLIDGCFDNQKSFAHKKAHIIMGLGALYGGGAGIRTLDRFNPMPVFKTGAFDHSATPPNEAHNTRLWRLC